MTNQKMNNIDNYILSVDLRCDYIHSIYFWYSNKNIPYELG